MPIGFWHEIDVTHYVSDDRLKFWKILDCCSTRLRAFWHALDSRFYCKIEHSFGARNNWRFDSRFL